MNGFSLLLALICSVACQQMAAADYLRNSQRSLRRFDDSCIAAVQVTDFEDGSDETTLTCQTPSGKFYTIPSVSKEWIDEKLAKAELKSGITGLAFPGGAFVDDKKAQIVTPNGVPPGLVRDAGRQLNTFRRMGNKSVLAVRVVTSDDTTVVSESIIADELFGPNLNLKTQMAKCSYNQLLYEPAANRNGASVNIVNGVVTVSLLNAATEGDGVLRNAVSTALQAEFGVSASSLADHVMYCLPNAAMSGIAYAYINSWNSVYKNQWCTYPSAQMHEIGHNIGLAHANDYNYNTGSNVEYDDRTGMMGFSYSNLNGPEMCFNPAKSWQLGWYNSQSVTYNPTATCGEVNLLVGSIVDYTGVAADVPVLYQLEQPKNSTFALYMTYNSQTGINSGTREGGNQLVITAQGGNGIDYARSTLEGRISAGQQVLLQNFDATPGSLKVTFNSVSARVANVSLQWMPNDAALCPGTSNPTATPTSVPTKSPTASPTTAPTPVPAPTATPTSVPTKSPTASPTTAPTPVPAPTGTPTSVPTTSPTLFPTDRPSGSPTVRQCQLQDEVCVTNSDCCDFRGKCQLQDRKNKDSPLVCSK